MNPSGKLVDNMLRDAKRYLESLTYKAPQDDALALAQQRAALPVEQGGSGPYAVPAAVAGLAGASMAPSEAEAGIAGVLAKNADLDMLKIAKQAEAQGLPMNKIYDATGFARGVDDQWRWEFSDNGAELTMTPRAGQSGRQSGLLDNPSLYESYPDMKNLHTEAQNTDGYSGSYHKAENGYPEKIRVNSDLNYKDMLLTMLHENQHGVQARENFATGGAPDWEQAKRADKFLPQWQQRGEVYDLMHDNKMTRDQVIKAYEGLPEQGFAEFYYDELSPGGLFSDLSKSDIEKAITHWKEQQNPEDVYTRLAGEVESRNVEGRRGMSSEYRRMLPFFETEDVPRSRQIVRGVKYDPTVSALKSSKLSSDRSAMTHYAPKPLAGGAKVVRDMAVEMMNPASWPLLWGSRELGRPEDLKFTNGAWSSR